MRFYVIPTRLEKPRSWKGCGTGKALCTASGSVQIGTALQNNMAKTCKTELAHTKFRILPINLENLIHVGYSCTGAQNMYKYVHSGIIHNGKKDYK